MEFLGVNHYTSDLVSLTEEAVISDPSYHYDKGYYRYKNESWPGSASSSLKVQVYAVSILATQVCKIYNIDRWYQRVSVPY